MELFHRVLCRLLLAMLALVVMVASLLLAVVPAEAETSAKIGTAITIGASRTDVTPTSGAVQVSGVLRRLSDKSALIGAKVALTAKSITTGKVISTAGAVTDRSGSYAIEINPSASVNISVAFYGSPSYDSSVSRSVRITVQVPAGGSYSPGDPRDVTVPLIDVVCDGFKNTMGKFGGDGPTGDVVRGAFADQTAANCKGEKKSFFSSFEASLKEVAGRLAIEKSLKINASRDLVDPLVNLFSVSSPRVKLMPDSAKRTYDNFLQNVTIIAGSASNACLRLSVPDAANCVQGVQASVRRLATLAV